MGWVAECSWPAGLACWAGLLGLLAGWAEAGGGLGYGRWCTSSKNGQVAMSLASMPPGAGLRRGVNDSLGSRSAAAWPSDLAAASISHDKAC